MSQRIQGSAERGRSGDGVAPVAAALGGFPGPTWGKARGCASRPKLAECGAPAEIEQRMSAKITDVSWQPGRGDAAAHVAAAPRQHIVVCLGGDRTTLVERPMPSPGAGEILLRLRVVGLCGTDLYKLATGGAPIGGVLGHELVGQVVATGSGVTGFGAGDRVAVPHHVPCGTCILCRRGNETMCQVFRENLLAPGGFADYVLVRPRATDVAARRLPDHVADEAAVFMEPAACVLRGVRRSGIERDGTAVVLGAGSMGLLHLLVLRAVFSGHAVIVVDPVAERRRLALRLGAVAATAPGDETAAAVMSGTAGVGADAVFDTVGGDRTLAAGLELTRQGGTVVLFAHAPEGAPAAVDLNLVFKYERRILGTYSAAVTEQAEVFDLLCSGAFDPSPLVSHRLPLEQFAEGVALARQHRALKVLFTPSLAGKAS
jgi:L-iditol 2-dehydrogenase